MDKIMEVSFQKDIDKETQGICVQSKHILKIHVLRWWRKGEKKEGEKEGEEKQHIN